MIDVDVIQVLLLHFIFSYAIMTLPFLKVVESMVVHAVLYVRIQWLSEHVACEMDFFMLGTLTISSSYGSYCKHLPEMYIYNLHMIYCSLMEQKYEWHTKCAWDCYSGVNI